MRLKGSYFSGSSPPRRASSTNLSINPNRTPRMAFRTQSNSFSSRGCSASRRAAMKYPG